MDSTLNILSLLKLKSQLLLLSLPIGRRMRTLSVSWIVFRKTLKVGANCTIIIEADSNNPFASFGEGADDLCFISSEHLAWFYEWMTEHSISLLRSPPFSGKQLLPKFLGSIFRRNSVGFYLFPCLIWKVIRRARVLNSLTSGWNLWGCHGHNVRIAMSLPTS